MLWEKVRGEIAREGLRPASLRDVADAVGIDTRRLEALLVRAGRHRLVHRVSKTRYCTREMLAELALLAEAAAAGAPDGMLGVAAFRDVSGIGRNMAIEVLEYFDKLKFTQRRGEAREIRMPARDLLA